MMSPVKFIKRIKVEVSNADDLTIMSMLMMRYNGSQLFGDMEDGFVVYIDGLLYDTNGLACGKAKPAKISDDDVIDMWNDRNFNK